MSRNLNLTSTTSSKINLENITVSSGTGLESVDKKLYFNGEEVRSGGGLTHSAQILTSDGEIDFSNTSTLLKTGHVYTLPDGIDDMKGFKKDIVNMQASKTELSFSPVVDNKGINGLNNFIRQAVTIGDVIYAVGGFTILGSSGAAAMRIAKYNMTTNEWSNLENNGQTINGFNGTVFTVEKSHDESNLYIGGKFTSLSDGTHASCIARYSIIDNEYYPLSKGIKFVKSEKVKSIKTVNSNIYIGGRFEKLDDNTVVNGIVIYNTLTETFNPIITTNGTGVSELCDTLEVSHDKRNIYIGGEFTFLSDGSTHANRICRYSIDDNLFSSVIDKNNIDGVNYTILSILALENEIYVGGQFLYLQSGDNLLQPGKNVNGIARYSIINNEWTNVQDINGATGIHHGSYKTLVGENNYIMTTVVRTLKKIGEYIYIGGILSRTSTSPSNGPFSYSILSYHINDNEYRLLNDGIHEGFKTSSAFYYISDIVKNENKLYVLGFFSLLKNIESNTSNNKEEKNICLINLPILDSTINGKIYQDNQLTTSYTLSNSGKYISPMWIGYGWAL